jgi:hypothetical protein
VSATKMDDFRKTTLKVKWGFDDMIEIVVWNVVKKVDVDLLLEHRLMMHMDCMCEKHGCICV